MFQVKEIVRQCDLFYVPHRLAVGGRQKFGTLVGGISTIAFVAFFATFVMISLKRALEDPNLISNQAMSYFSPMSSNEPYSVSTTDSTIAVSI